MAQIDHLVFGAATLAEGEAWMTERLGCPPAVHGRHALMSTHNALWRLDGCYLEVITVDPDAPDPGRKRWYGLDDPHVRERLVRGPALLTWVVSVDWIDPSTEADHGPAIRVTRDALSWQLTVPEDGKLRAGGALPTLIAWDPDSPSPATTLPESGLRLDRLVLGSGEASVAKCVARYGLQDRVEIDPEATHALSARITQRDGDKATLV
ncbi:MAG: VOC family protein [Pseudomonadota bacterium]